MPTKITVGLCKKRGLPDFGSIGASCKVEIELDAHVLEGDPNKFRQHVRRAYNACRESVEAELMRGSVAEPGDDHESNDSQHPGRNGSSSGNGSRRAATQSQVRAIHAIAGRNHVGLAPILERFKVRAVTDLDIRDASTIIDELKSNMTGNGSAR